MKPILATLAICLTFCLTTFANDAATRPADVAQVPTTAPTTSPSASKLLDPAEILERLKRMRAEKDALLRVAYFDLDSELVERPADFSLFGDPDATTLQSLLARLRQAREDESLRGVLVTIEAGVGMNLAQAQELRDALAALHAAGKKSFVYADSYDTVTYTLASGATDVCLLDGGEIVIPGVGGQALFAKGLLDKVGVTADMIQVGEYKGADEQYTRSAASDELRGEMTRLMDDLYGQIVEGIAEHRNLSPDTVRRLVDETMLSAEQAKAHGLVDHLLDQDALRELIESKLGDEIDLVYDYGEPERDEIDFSNPWALLAMLGKRPERSDKPTVALVFAEGMIVDGDGGAGALGTSVGSDEVREALRVARRDERIKAVVIRIDSPGGSALASEVMWRAARRVANDKPLVVSVGNMAASGGYYLATAGDTIYADPAGVVGSIGVVGGKLVVKDLLTRLGVTTENFSRGANADLYSMTEPFDDRQRMMVRAWMTRIYDQFTARVMETRKDKIKDIDAVARGRVFVAARAKELGMVDEIGGLEDALDRAARDAKLEPGQWDVRILPAPKTLADLFAGGGAAADARTPVRPQVKITVSPDSVFNTLGPAMRKLVGRHVQLLHLLEERPVTLVAPFVITVR